ncbi:glucosamine-6-phosphate deaminase [Microbacterium sp. Mu-80]|uniref:Glucosamine-6-phosphate deaminase n=1 Tax=Microbacterium bandirmense TaxID=3122050 RepID=A0ABU8LCN6_9MICO
MRHSIDLRIFPTIDGVGSAVADEIQELIQVRDNVVLGLATGSSPLATYRELRRRFTDGTVSLERARGFLLDEYVGLPRGHRETYRAVIERELGNRVGFGVNAIAGPDVWAPDLADACERYEEQIATAGGIDLQILGIGSNGHIGFNEPGSDFASRTRVSRLTDQTRADNARFFGDDIAAVPTHCVTQGLGTIGEARRIVLIATGHSKSHAVARLLTDPATPDLPASALLNHPSVTLFADAAAVATVAFSASGDQRVGNRA